MSLAYTWELDLGAYPAWQYLKPGKDMTPLDCDMEDDISDIAARRKLERVASYRQLQGYSNQIHQLSKCQLTIDDFSLPSNCHVREVTADEGRKTEVIHGRNVTFIVDKHSDERLQVLPHDLVNVRLLTLGLDHGSIGAGGCAFGTYHLKKLMHAKWDIIHRLINDMGDSERKTCDGEFRKAKAFSQYLYGYCNRPFGSGAGFTLKQRMLEVFRITETIDSPVFIKYQDRVAGAFNLGRRTTEERQEVFDRCSELASFQKKMGAPKAQNWFAWHKVTTRTESTCGLGLCVRHPASRQAFGPQALAISDT